MHIDIKESLVKARSLVNVIIDEQRASTTKEQSNLMVAKVGAKAFFDILESVAIDLRRIANALERPNGL